MERGGGVKRRGEGINNIYWVVLSRIYPNCDLLCLMYCYLPYPICICCCSQRNLDKSIQIRSVNFHTVWPIWAEEGLSNSYWVTRLPECTQIVTYDVPYWRWLFFYRTRLNRIIHSMYTQTVFYVEGFMSFYCWQKTELGNRNVYIEFIYAIYEFMLKVFYSTHFGIEAHTGIC